MPLKRLDMFTFADGHPEHARALGLPALWLHDRWRRDQWRPGAWLAPAVLALGLAGGESALGVVAYLAAHALVFESGGLLSRLAKLWPYALVLVGWRALYHA